MAFFPLGAEPDPDRDAMMRFQLDQMIKRSVQLLWFAMPPQQRDIDEVEKLFAQLVARSFQDLRNSNVLLEEWQSRHNAQHNEPDADGSKQ